MGKGQMQIPMRTLMGIILMLLALWAVSDMIFAPVEEEAPGSQFGKGDMGAFQKLSYYCSRWTLYIDQCPDCDCDLCKGAFFETTGKAYEIPILLFKSGIVKAGASLSAGELYSNSEFCEACTSSGSTFKCAEAASLLVGSSSPDEVDSSQIKDVIKDDADVRSQLIGEKSVGGEKTNYAGACAAVCRVIAEKRQKCQAGPELCATDATKLP